MFSKNENKLLKLIKKKPKSLKQLTEEFYEGDVPFEGRKSVANLVNRISAKLNKSELTWGLESKGAGRAGKVVWKKTKQEDIV